MNSEQLGDLLAREGAAPAHVPVRRARIQDDADLVAALPGPLSERVRGRVVAALAGHPDVASAVLEGGTLRVRVTEAARVRSLRAGVRTMPEANLVAPDRPLLLSDRPGAVTPAAAAAVVGPDAVAYALARAHRRGAHGPVRLDVEAAVRRTPANPLFTVQWAHARAVAFTLRAAALGVPSLGDNEPTWGSGGADGPDGPGGPVRRLVASLVELPATVARAVRRDELGPVPVHLEEIAGLLLEVEPERRFLPAPDEPATRVHSSGVVLVTTAAQMTARTLGMLGVGAPSRI